MSTTSAYMDSPVAYLENDDFDEKGDLINPRVPRDIPVVVMVQANFCRHSAKAKPSFQKFADRNNGRVFAATIQVDGKERNEPELGKRIREVIPKFRGYPQYCLYVDGQWQDRKLKGEGSEEELEKFAGLV